LVIHMFFFQLLAVGQERREKPEGIGWLEAKQNGGLGRRKSRKVCRQYGNMIPYKELVYQKNHYSQSVCIVGSLPFL